MTITETSVEMMQERVSADVQDAATMLGIMTGQLEPGANQIKTPDGIPADHDCTRCMAVAACGLLGSPQILERMKVVNALRLDNIDIAKVPANQREALIAQKRKELNPEINPDTNINVDTSIKPTPLPEPSLPPHIQEMLKKRAQTQTPTEKPNPVTPIIEATTPVEVIPQNPPTPIPEIVTDTREIPSNNLVEIIEVSPDAPTVIEVLQPEKVEIIQPPEEAAVVVPVESVAMKIHLEPTAQTVKEAASPSVSTTIADRIDNSNTEPPQENPLHIVEKPILDTPDHNHPVEKKPPVISNAVISEPMRVSQMSEPKLSQPTNRPEERTVKASPIVEPIAQIRKPFEPLFIKPVDRIAPTITQPIFHYRTPAASGEVRQISPPIKITTEIHTINEAPSVERVQAQTVTFTEQSFTSTTEISEPILETFSATVFSPQEIDMTAPVALHEVMSIDHIDDSAQSAIETNLEVNSEAISVGAENESSVVDTVSLDEIIAEVDDQQIMTTDMPLESQPTDFTDTTLPLITEPSPLFEDTVITFADTTTQLENTPDIIQFPQLEYGQEKMIDFDQNEQILIESKHNEIITEEIDTLVTTDPLPLSDFFTSQTLFTFSEGSPAETQVDVSHIHIDIPSMHIYDDDLEVITEVTAPTENLLAETSLEKDSPTMDIDSTQSPESIPEPTMIQFTTTEKSFQYQLRKQLPAPEPNAVILIKKNEVKNAESKQTKRRRKLYQYDVLQTSSKFTEQLNLLIYELNTQLQFLKLDKELLAEVATMFELQTKPNVTPEELNLINANAQSVYVVILFILTTMQFLAQFEPIDGQNSST